MSNTQATKIQSKRQTSHENAATRFEKSSSAMYQQWNAGRSSKRSTQPSNTKDEELIFPMDDESNGSEYCSRYSEEPLNEDRTSRPRQTAQTQRGVPIRKLSSSSSSCDFSDMVIDEDEILDKLAEQDGKLSWGWK